MNPHEKDRIVGFDIARGVAILIMIMVNFRLAFNADYESSLLLSVVDYFTGKAAALFVILAGIGVTLLSKKAASSNDSKKLFAIKKRLWKRSLFLFIIGMAYLPIWPADILHFYAFYLSVAAFLINIREKLLWTITGIVVALYPLLLSVVDYDTGWNWATLEYIGFWTLKGFVHNLFVNGFHPFFPWIAFVLFGMILGRLDWQDQKLRLKLLFTGLFILLAVHFISISLMDIGQTFMEMSQDEAQYLFGTHPMPPFPFYILAGISFSLIVLVCSVYIGEWFRGSRLVKAMANTGQLALTLYIAHVVIGIGLVYLFTGTISFYRIEYVFAYAMLFGLACLLFSYFWVKKHGRGPLETVMRRWF